jgi:hypothetical protein
MIPYAELERALARWKARAHSDATEVGGHDIVHSSELGVRPGAPQPNGTSNEIDINELVESYDE